MDPFRLTSTDKNFNDRVTGLFNCLDEVSTTLPVDGLVFDVSAGKRSLHDATLEDSGRSNTRHLRAISDTRKSQNKSNVGHFVVPTSRNIPLKKFKGTPGFIKCPDKWTCYNMEDTQVMNEAQNKRAALLLLADLKHNKKAIEPMEDDKMDSDKIVFKKPSNIKPSNKEKSMSPASSSSNKDHNMSDDFGGAKKIHMEEYVVGTKKKNKKQKGQKKEAQNNEKEVKLSHLSFQDDDCE